jgi:hypothetical protein
VWIVLTALKDSCTFVALAAVFALCTATPYVATIFSPLHALRGEPAVAPDSAT